MIYKNALYLVDDDGSAKSINKLNGHVFWQHKIGTLAAASPAVGTRQGMVYIPLLSVNANAGQTPGNGRIVALSMKTGRVVWSHVIPPGTESSPIVWGPTLYFGDQSGTVYSMRARDGHVNWTYHASGAVKGGPALDNGILYFGDYAGRAYALNADNGHQIWAVSTDGARFGFGSGNFYSTPAVAFGRVYMGNTDGRVYSFAARTGQLAWATGTGAYVYSSAAVADPPGIGPTVYLGSYDGNFYAFNAQSGSIRWSHNAGGRISGSPTIIGDVVYFSDLGSRSTEGLNVRTGQQVFSFPDGAFNPAIADDGAIYLVGYSKIYQMLPRRSHQCKPVGESCRQRPRNAQSATKAPQIGRSRNVRSVARLLSLWVYALSKWKSLSAAGHQRSPVLRGSRGRARSHARRAQGRRRCPHRSGPAQAVVYLLPSRLLRAPCPTRRVLRYVLGGGIRGRSRVTAALLLTGHKTN